MPKRPTLGCRTHLLVPQKRVKANWAWASEYKVEEYEAMKDGEVATVNIRKEALWGVNHEITYRHFARRNKRGEAREKTNDNQPTANQLDSTLKPR
jgi:hypothetical protein